MSNIIGIQLLVVGSLMLACIPFSWFYNSGDAHHLLISGLITIATGIGFYWWRRTAEPRINQREGYLLVVLGWLFMVFFGMLPYLISGEIPSVTDAFFETMSGMTTTGASILNDIEAVPKGILIWRSLTQWIGGMGIIVLTVALFPLLGVGAVQLFGAEAPGPTSDKIHPRIRETAKRLWWIYVGLTFAATCLYWIEGMNFYDAINHALTTLATGGFSTKNASAAYYDNKPLIQYTMIFFMAMAGTNYTVIYFLIKGIWKKALKFDEFKGYLILITLLTIIITLSVWNVSGMNFEKSFRDSLFQIVSIITTTGFVSADYTSWSEALTMLFFIMLFLGACAGSTSGGIKIIRHLVFFKNSYYEFKRLLYPRAVIVLKLNKMPVASKVLTHILVFLLLFLMTFIIGSLCAVLLGMDFLTAIGAVATSLANVGPGIGDVGPVNNFADISDGNKWLLSFLMLLGRLELFTLLVLFTPYYWDEY